VILAVYLLTVRVRNQFQDLYHNASLRARLPLFIESFLKDRQFHVRLGSSYSYLFDQEMGVPEGSILSFTLFGLKINTIVKAISPGVSVSFKIAKGPLGTRPYANSAWSSPVVK